MIFTLAYMFCLPLQEGVLDEAASLAETHLGPNQVPASY